MNYLSLIGRNEALFQEDLINQRNELTSLVSNSKFLVIGGAGSIGQAVVKEIFKRDPKALHVVDISENNMVELVRDIRSTIGYGKGDFKTFAIDCGGSEFEALLKTEGPYDYIFNLSASIHFYANVIAPYKGSLEQWFVANRNLYIYFMSILVTAWAVLFPKTGIAWKVFIGIPTPPEELKSVLNFKE